MLTQDDFNKWDTILNYLRLNLDVPTILLPVLLRVEADRQGNNIFDRIQLKDEARETWVKFVDEALAKANDWQQPQAFKMSNGDIFIFLESLTLGRHGVHIQNDQWRYRVDR